MEVPCSVRGERTSRGEEDDKDTGRSHAFLKLAYVVELLHVEPRLDACDVHRELARDVLRLRLAGAL